MNKTVITGIIAVMLASCEKDNADGPNATFAGEIRDVQTGELVPQEISDGSRVYYIEEGWENPPVQQMVIKRDGTFMNSMMFAGDYKVILDKGNFVPLDTIEMQIEKGENFKTFEVQPYLRILDPEIRKEADSIVATFRVQQATDNPVYRISLFAHSHADVSNKLSIVSATEELNRNVKEDEVFRLTIDLAANSSILKPGKAYYFRIGAQALGDETKYNYADVKRMDVE